MASIFGNMGWRIFGYAPNPPPLPDPGPPTIDDRVANVLEGTRSNLAKVFSEKTRQNRAPLQTKRKKPNSIQNITYCYTSDGGLSRFKRFVIAKVILAVLAYVTNWQFSKEKEFAIIRAQGTIQGSLWETYIRTFKEAKCEQAPNTFFAKIGHNIHYYWIYSISYLAFAIIAPLCTLSITSLVNNIFRALEKKIENQGREDALGDEILTIFLEGLNSHYSQVAQAMTDFSKGKGPPSGQFSDHMENNLAIIRKTPKEEVIRSLANVITKFLPGFSLWTNWKNSTNIAKSIVGHIMGALEYIPMCLLYLVFRKCVLPKIIARAFDTGINELGDTFFYRTVLGILTKIVNRIKNDKIKFYGFDPNEPAGYKKITKVEEKAELSGPHINTIGKIAKLFCQIINKWPALVSEDSASDARKKNLILSRLPDNVQEEKDGVFATAAGSLDQKSTDELLFFINKKQTAIIALIITEFASFVSDPKNLKNLLEGVVSSTNNSFTNADPEEPLYSVDSQWYTEFKELLLIMVQENLAHVLPQEPKKENGSYTDQQKIVEGKRALACAHIIEFLRGYQIRERAFVRKTTELLNRLAQEEQANALALPEELFPQDNAPLITMEKELKARLKRLKEAAIACREFSFFIPKFGLPVEEQMQRYMLKDAMCLHEIHEHIRTAREILKQKLQLIQAVTLCKKVPENNFKQEIERVLEFRDVVGSLNIDPGAERAKLDLIRKYALELFKAETILRNSTRQDLSMQNAATRIGLSSAAPLQNAAGDAAPSVDAIITDDTLRAFCENHHRLILQQQKAVIQDLRTKIDAATPNSPIEKAAHDLETHWKRAKEHIYLDANNDPRLQRNEDWSDPITDAMSKERDAFMDEVESMKDFSFLDQYFTELDNAIPALVEAFFKNIQQKKFAKFAKLVTGFSHADITEALQSTSKQCKKQIQNTNIIRLVQAIVESSLKETTTRALEMCSDPKQVQSSALHLVNAYTTRVS